MRVCAFSGGRRQGRAGVYPWAYVPRMVCRCRCFITAYRHTDRQALVQTRPVGPCVCALPLNVGMRLHCFKVHSGRAATVCVARRTLVLAKRIVEGYEKAPGVPCCLSAVFAFRCTLGRVIGLWHTGAQEILSSARGGQRKLVAAPPS